MSVHVASKGPLGSAVSQWVMVGIGTVVIFSGDNSVSKAAQELAQSALRVLAGRSAVEASLLPARVPSPIVIHNVSPQSESRRSWLSLIMGAGAIWGVYLALGQLLPASLKELLPVSQRYFETAVTSLGQGILKVRDVLSEQIALVAFKQDQLAEKQDHAHADILKLRTDVGEVRVNIDDIAVAISRCETSLTDAASRQTYMSRGVRLLVQSVGDLLRHSNPSVAEQLEQFSRLSEEMDTDFHYRDKSYSPSPSSLVAPLKRSRLECPSSPNISEIGSISAGLVDDICPLPPTSSPKGSETVSLLSPQLGPKNYLLGMRSRSVSRQGSCPESEVPGAEKDSPVPLQEVDQLLAMIRGGGFSPSQPV